MQFFRFNKSIIVAFDTEYTIQANQMIVGLGYVLSDTYGQQGPYSAGQFIPLTHALTEIDVNQLPESDRSKIVDMAKRIAKQVKELPKGASLGKAWRLSRHSEFFATMERVPEVS